MGEREGAAPAAPWRERGEVLSRRIHELIHAGAGAEAHAVEIELYALLRRHSTARDAAASAYTIAQEHQAAADYTGALTAFRDARTMFVELGDTGGLAAADLGIALMHASVRRLDLAFGALHESAGQLLRVGAVTAAARAHVSAAAFLMLDQRHPEAESELDTADRLLGASASRAVPQAASRAVPEAGSGDSDAALVFVAAIVRARLAVVAGRTGDAHSRLARARLAAAEDPLFLGFVQDQQAQLALQNGDRVAYGAALLQAVPLFLAGGAPRPAAVELARVGAALEARGAREKARELLTQSAELLRRLPADPARSAEARVSPYLVVADLEFDQATLARLARLPG
jgi:hypothetical protein